MLALGLGYSCTLCNDGRLMETLFDDEMLKIEDLLIFQKLQRSVSCGIRGANFHCHYLPLMQQLQVFSCALEFRGEGRGSLFITHSDLYLILYFDDCN